jgi:phosphoribosylformylglycinamidine synthase
MGGTKISIPPTVLFTASAVLEDVNKSVSMDVKAPGDVVYALGDTADELGGSEYLALRGQLGSTAPKVDTPSARDRYERLAAAIEQRLIASCHDCSDGGLGAALAESAFAGGFGMDLDLTGLGVEDAVVALFSESQSRLVVTIRPEKVAEFEEVMGESAVYRLGVVTESPVFKAACPRDCRVESPIDELKEAWQAPLRW